MNLIRIRFADLNPIYKKLFYLSLIIYSLSIMINNNQTMQSTTHWCTTPDQDVYVTIEAMGHNSHILPKQNEHPGYGHKLLYAYYFKLLNTLNVSEYHKIEDFCQTPEPLKIWPIMIKNARMLSFFLFIVFCLIMGLTCWQLTGKPWAFPIGFYFCSLFPGGQYQSFIIRSELIATIMGCTGILFTLMSLNAKRYLSYIAFSILSGACIFIAIITKIHAVPFLFFIIVIFVFFPTNKSKFIENISAKMLCIPASVIIFILPIVHGWGKLQIYFSHHSLPYKGGFIGLIFVSFLLFLYYSLRTRLENKTLKRILQLLSDYPTKNKFSSDWLLTNKLFVLISIIIIILIIYSTTPVWIALWDRFQNPHSLLHNLYLWGLIIVSSLLIYLSYSLRTRLENKVLKRMLSIGYFLLGFIFFGITILYLSLLPFHTWNHSWDGMHILVSHITNPIRKFGVYVTPDISISFFYSVLIKWWEIYSFLLFSLICFSCYFLFSRKIASYNKLIFILLILMSYLYVNFSSLRYFVENYYIFNDVFLILGFIYLFSELSNIIILNKIYQSCLTVLIVGWMSLIPHYIPVPHQNGALNLDMSSVYSILHWKDSIVPLANVEYCIHWTYPSSESKVWIHDKYFQCIERAYPTKEIFLHNLRQ